MSKFLTTLELEVAVVGHYTGETHATFEEPGESARFELEAVLLIDPNPEPGRRKQLDILPWLGQDDVEELERCGLENAEDDRADEAAVQAEARRDAKEDR